MAFLANAEARLTKTTQRIVKQPTVDVLAVTTPTADELQAACIEGIQWLTANTCPIPRVGSPLHEVVMAIGSGAVRWKVSGLGGSSRLRSHSRSVYRFRKCSRAAAHSQNV